MQLKKNCIMIESDIYLQCGELCFYLVLFCLSRTTVDCVISSVYTPSYSVLAV